MDAILLFTHGSVLCGAERHLLDIANAIRASAKAPIVEVGFLNYNEPRFAEAVARCVAQGATRITVVPYFLVAGKTVTKDLRAELDKARVERPGVEFLTAEVIGFHDELADAVLTSARSAKTPGEWRVALSEATEHCRENPKCPLHGHPGCRIEATA